MTDKFVLRFRLSGAVMLQRRNVITILDFALFAKKAENIIMECVKPVRTKADIIFTDKLEPVMIELPKFNKTATESVTRQIDGYSRKYRYPPLYQSCKLQVMNCFL
jgi:hypothetical protein